MSDSVRQIPCQIPVRSFVRREGRLTRGQQRALEGARNSNLMLDGDNSQAQEWHDFFSSPNPVVLEIGFGNGESLIRQAQQHPDWQFLGIEVHRPGVGHLLGLCQQHHVNNVRVVVADAVEVLGRCVPNCSVDRTQVFFPDPWPKKKHHKRRLLQPPFIALMASKLKLGGFFHFATDWKDYATSVAEMMRSVVDFRLVEDKDLLQSFIDDRGLTKFEQRGMKLGHQVSDLVYQYQPTSSHCL